MSTPLSDDQALQLAVQMACAEDADRADQITAMLKEQPWREVAEFAAYVCQTTTLNLKPWSWPPCWGPNRNEDAQGARLLAQMLALGISQWHPDPMRAIEEVKA
jgi:hypothetical protein